MAVKCALGLMSGTSMDGIDIAAIETDGRQYVARLAGHFVAYDAAFRRKIEDALPVAAGFDKRHERPEPIAMLERELTLRHGEAVKAFLAFYPQLKPDVIGFHGQTVLHRPERALTVQLGKGQLLADETGIAVISDMRANDMAHGGQGAPLAPAYHAALTASLPPGMRQGPVCFVNIGGISNITFVAPGRDPIAFDTGPGNALIDQWVARKAGIAFDEDGAVASKGKVAKAIVARYLAHPFFARTGAKSLDRNDFTLSEAEGLDLTDGARTLAAVTAEAILAATRHLPKPPKLWIVCGGGRHNPHIMADLRKGAAHLGGDVVAAEKAGFDGDFMEAEAWAYLAVRARQDLPLSWPTTTGCRQPVSGGLVSYPRS